MKVALVCGAGGFIGGHLCKRLKSEGYYVVGVDLKYNEYWPDAGEDSIGDMTLDGYYDKFYIADLRETKTVRNLIHKFSPQEIYQLAADMGGAGYIFSGDHDADVMHNSCMINLNVLDAVAHNHSACMRVIAFAQIHQLLVRSRDLIPDVTGAEGESFRSALDQTLPALGLE